MRQGIPNPLFLMRLIFWLRGNHPDVIQTWMYHADLIGGVAAKFSGGIPITWGIHHTTINSVSTKWLTKRTVQLCSMLAKWLPTHIVCCSETSKKVHEALGYPTEIMEVITNGFSLNKFHPSSDDRLSLRQELGIFEDTILVGHIGRFVPEKDHRNFIQAASRLCSKYSNVEFLMCGAGVTWENSELVKLIEEAGIRSRVYLLGKRDDIPRIMASLDILAQSSCCEAFPLVGGEAMASGVPCVVTDVGDSALLVGDTGSVVEPRNYKELAKALGHLIDLGENERKSLGIKARQRIEKYFNLPDIVRKYENIYIGLSKVRRN